METGSGDRSQNYCQVLTLDVSEIPVRVRAAQRGGEVRVSALLWHIYGHRLTAHRRYKYTQTYVSYRCLRATVVPSHPGHRRTTWSRWREFWAAGVWSRLRCLRKHTCVQTQAQTVVVLRCCHRLSQGRQHWAQNRRTNTYSSTCGPLVLGTLLWSQCGLLFL